MVLFGDLVPGLVAPLLPPSPDALLRTLCVGSGLLLIFPLSSSNNLTPLRFTSILSYASVLALVTCLAIRAVESVKADPSRWQQLRFFDSLEGVGYSLPIVVSCYLMHSNVLQVRAEQVCVRLSCVLCICVCGWH